jgi:hypothetical protein
MVVVKGQEGLSPLPLHLVGPTCSSKACSVVPTLDGCGQHGPSSASSCGVDRPLPLCLVDTACSGNALGIVLPALGEGHALHSCKF